MKKLKLWVAVDGDGWAAGYSRKPTWNKKLGWYESFDWFAAVFPEKLQSHAGKCWRVEIPVPPVTKKRRAKR